MSPCLQREVGKQVSFWSEPGATSRGMESSPKYKSMSDRSESRPHFSVWLRVRKAFVLFHCELLERGALTFVFITVPPTPDTCLAHSRCSCNIELLLKSPHYSWHLCQLWEGTLPVGIPWAYIQEDRGQGLPFRCTEKLKGEVEGDHGALKLDHFSS